MSSLHRPLPDSRPLRIHPGTTTVVVGTGRSGLAAAALLDHLGGAVRLVDSGTVSQEVRDLAEKRGWDVREGEHCTEQFERAALVVLSPGVNRRKLAPWLTGLRAAQVIAELELALGFVDAPITAVTGTSGKTTTATLIGRFLEAAGRRVFVGGNIGTPLSRYVLERMLAAEAGSSSNFKQADNLVLEVSSFQLLNTSSLRPNVGVLLNVSPNHLDYHQDMEEYLQAKLSLFAQQEPEDTAVFAEEMRELVRTRCVTRARTVYFGTQSDLICPALPGRHNRANIAAAFQACLPFGLTHAAAQTVLDGFIGLPHRLQIVAERDGVVFVDDSKGTTVQALRAALEAFDRPVLLLAGGVFKGGDLAGLNPLVRSKTKAVGLFGASREIFEAAWADAGTSLFWEPTLELAMDRLWHQAQPGDVMLLSPATASFDLFRDYKHRGMTFQGHLQTLGERGHE
ncbi:UDP-N-acetylmuramoyl-L-alanine--D-glutamate ligase [Desulfonatronum sp. SC1]|uniref:UDP-N-acetylmuramoyl-L-alanine--D-glutamate ligase n=1 Tax=Desulfonatronum sp. SC1 TaxID=2109626 RepID=UPI000D31C2CF|nr:UDP-N-acetylmuramoyl-L-alanine--D-glutamate ligase [Desulfonatronum sp. SC1]PTN33076.1 UDP-N-acetylmuramoyl-L-alanine--D-glutamate ligase [Desulfonatronum sp. SC1]